MGIDPKQPNVSTRMRTLQSSPTIALNSKAKRLRADGADVLNFAVGEPDFSTPAEITEIALAALKNGKTRYGPAGGGEPLRSAISEKLQSENGLQFPPQNIVCGMGAKEILFHTFLAILNEGDEVLLTAPFWVSYQDQIKAAGGVPILVPMQDGQPVFDRETIESFASPRTVAYVLCSPNNPGGYSLDREQLKALGTYLDEKNWWVISDEIYEYLVFDRPHISLLNVQASLSERFILINGLSKSFAMTGWRVGYAAGPSVVIDLVRKLQSHSSTCLPPFIEEAATWAVAAGAAFMADKVALLKKRRDLAVSCIDKIADVSSLRPEGAFYIFLDLRKVLAKSKHYAPCDSLGFCEELLESKHVVLVPGEAFGAPGFVRMSYATDDQTIIRGTESLQAMIESL